jgi:hypothetical protein
MLVSWNIYRIVSVVIRVRNNWGPDPDLFFDKKICINVADFSSKWSKSSLITYGRYIFLKKSLKSLKVLQQSHFVHLKFANYLVCLVYKIGSGSTWEGVSGSGKIHTGPQRCKCWVKSRLPDSYSQNFFYLSLLIFRWPSTRHQYRRMPKLLS